MTTDISTALATFDLASYEARIQEAEAIRAQILKKFPLDQWPAMPLEKYALGGAAKEETFSYWIEFKSSVLGSIGGGSAEKLIIYKRKDGTGWYHPKKFTDVQQAWAAVRGEYVKAFKHAKDGDWDAIDQLELISDKSITLKTLYIYYPELLLPVYSAKHLVHFLEKLGVPKSEWRKMGRAAQNRRLLSLMRAQPQSATWNGLQMMWFLYDWAPLPADTNKLAPPFDQMFEDAEDANWAFDFLAEIAKRMGVLNPADKQAAFTIRQVGKQWKLRFIFANWVLAEVISRNGVMEEVGLTLPRRDYDNAEDSYQLMLRS